MAKPESLTIFMITNNYTPYSGGVVSSLNSSIHELRLLGHKVILITLDFLGITYTHEADVIRIPCPIRFTYYKNHMAIPWRPTQFLSELITIYKPDIIHTHHPFLLGSSALKVAKQYKIPVVFTYHTIYEKYLHYVPLPTAFIEPLTKTWVKAFCNKVNALIVPTESLQKYLLENHAIKSTIAIIPSAILPLFIKPSFKYKPPRKNRFTLLFVSRFAPEKNIPFLLTMYTHLDRSRFELVLIGYGPSLGELQKYAYDDLRLSPSDVHFIIKPSKEELVMWYDKAHLFVFASQTETQGLVLAEAMARGTPVIALQGTAIEDIIKHNYNGFIISSVQEMSSLISHIECHPKVYKRLQYAAWKTGLNYQPSKCTLRLISLYTQILTTYSS